MADGAFRFQGAGQYFYQPQSQRQLQTRHGSPITTSQRIPFHTQDTPSPNRSPGANSPAFTMFNQHGILNGNSHQRFQMHMNMSKQFGQQQQSQQNLQTHHQNQGHSQQQQQPHHSQHQQHHHDAFANHSHNLSSSTPHFTPSHMQSQTPLSTHSQLSKPTSEHWQEQLRLAQASRDATQPHYYARNAHVASRQAIAQLGPGARKTEENKEERGRRMPYHDEKHPFTAIDFGGQGLRALAENLFKYYFLEKLYVNQNKLNWLVPEIGMLRRLTFLDLSQNDLAIIPAEIGMLTNLRTLLLIDNNLVDLPSELGYLYQLETLGLEGNPLNDNIKDLIAESGTGELIRTLREHAQGPARPEERDWIVLDEAPAGEQERFRVYSHNILCDKYTTEAQYGYAPSHALLWENRREDLLKLIRDSRADIICLQEIDAESFNEYFRPQLAHNDYRGMFWQKSRAHTMSEKNAKLVDGCATFYNNTKYILLDKQVVEFGRTAINRPDMKGEHDIFNRVMTRDDIATVAFLESRQSGARQMVVNLHLFWDPQFKDVKVVQVAILLEQLNRLSREYAKWPALKDKELFRYANGDEVDEEPVEKAPPAPSQEYASNTDIPLIICGDFNSTSESGVYDLLEHGSLSSSHDDLAGRKYGNFTKEGMAHPFSLKSSYSHIGELDFTNYTPTFVGCIDYIWYSTNALNVTGLLGEIDKQYLSRVPGFPHIHQPSDHINLLAEFAVKVRKESKRSEADFGHSSHDHRHR
ncbi:hypothetical protein AUEXF2481DRAFT_43416 [Aureobasidium subglaciale EXF-2481]|uniref:CCR4-Not complex 3'-5'-exoribonuclease subunit Ccr4 n=1 Tax=Aureobasidium subglaciale (strain EXF-2481) TaxID=1043005 RepID=A0A074YYV3_AURSE|nr:uncharacterized protein AUEXF2481DRAFT_43416 [Aureobasidium subglaciale EXF-2481]KAI5207324.1 hypothetical protein E4T38_03435 [Aureobasidium subglaciale]KAI5226257.1 hypothetical protein E4T40_03186 [Aureobasidium subglaciale]KAI5229577.1 hypothetical protein E4T41_03432 [Aureobasidium subglaciale]KAI5236111.1 hypothetical protein E4T43_08827 [Aureobasidium subglaciale]KAI5264210.1 hypothetical protein E4T46_03209 [Aureobasidium subglaciale]